MKMFFDLLNGIKMYLGTYRSGRGLRSGNSLCQKLNKTDITHMTHGYQYLL